MKKLSILIPTFKTWRLTAVCIHAYKTYGVPVESEIILCDNAPGHAAIKAITETSLGEGIRVIQGDPLFSSHGHGYDLAYDQSDGDWIFTSESDSFPTRHGWFDEWVKASASNDLIGPSVPQSSGRYIHPAGTAVSRLVLDKVLEWQKAHQDWVFAPSAGIELGLSDKAYHVVASREFLRERPVLISTAENIHTWKKAGPWQEMRSFDEDSFSTYSQRHGISNFEPVPGKNAYLKIGYEAGQWLHYFARHSGFRCLEATSHIEWMPGFEGGQAAWSTVFGGFTHIWAGTVTTVSEKDMHPNVVAYKRAELGKRFQALPDDIKNTILKLEKEHGQA